MRVRVEVLELLLLSNPLICWLHPFDSKIIKENYWPRYYHFILLTLKPQSSFLVYCNRLARLTIAEEGVYICGCNVLVTMKATKTSAS